MDREGLVAALTAVFKDKQLKLNTSHQWTVLAAIVLETMSAADGDTAKPT